MRMRIVFSLALMTLLAAVPLLSACHTVEGAGQDVTSTGRTVQRALP
jgi:predicted small secreted protein